MLSPEKAEKDNLKGKKKKGKGHGQRREKTRQIGEWEDKVL